MNLKSSQYLDRLGDLVGTKMWRLITTVCLFVIGWTDGFHESPVVTTVFLAIVTPMCAMEMSVLLLRRLLRASQG